jgi:uncharacterized protein YyaL (SSP411 family)
MSATHDPSSSAHAGRTPNRLIHETSPYLQQHAYNPVDWYAWGPEALEKARREDKPLLVSIGYSACHWCHVMERESFESEAIAKLLNERFVPIKVDREERPDLDHIYMNAVQMLTGHGGWPLNVFCTPEGKPFWGGTYFPPEQRHQMPGFKQILESLSDTWKKRRGEIHKAVDQIANGVERANQLVASDSDVPGDLLVRAADALVRAVDQHHGGLGQAPKFPNTLVFELFLRAWKVSGEKRFLDAVTVTLDRMAAGGIYDHLGGGFARYSTDERWLVPHFEKMLYDNALLAELYLEGFLATGNADYERVAEETLDWVLADMTDASGGFYSTRDADSEGVEGKFYVWGRAELEGILGRDEAKLFARVYDVSEGGNWEGASILNRLVTDEQAAKLFEITPEEVARRLAASRKILKSVRSRRVHPGRDEKILTAWNGLMLSALARAGAAFGRADYVAAARKNAEFVWERLRDERGRLLAVQKDGRSRLPAYVDDYAFYARGLLDLFDATFDATYASRARELGNALLEHFEDREAGGFFFTAHDHEPLAARTKTAFDGAIPSGNGIAVHVLLRLHALTEDERYLEAAERTLDLYAESMMKQPFGLAKMIQAFEVYGQGPTEVVIAGDLASPKTQELLAKVRSLFLPSAIVYAFDPSKGAPAPAFARDRRAIPGDTAVYVCRNRACAAPVTTWEKLAPLLG